MDLQHVLGRTWAAEGATALLPLYFLSEKDVILIDTGYAKLDRSGLTHLIDDNGLRLRGIICSHAHFDHTGNVRYLQQRYGCPAAIQLIEAGISVNPDSYRANYVALTYGKSRQLFLEECFTADIVIGAEDDHLDLRRTYLTADALPCSVCCSRVFVHAAHGRGSQLCRTLWAGRPALLFPFLAFVVLK